MNVGLIPSSEEGWPVACNALKELTGGWLHIHGNVTIDSKVAAQGATPSCRQQFERYSHILSLKCIRCVSVTNWIGYVVEQVLAILENSSSVLSQVWVVEVRHVEHVKSYAPHIHHLVLDLECRPQ